MSKYLDDQYNTVLENDEGLDLYRIIAERLVNDQAYNNNLLFDPRKTLEETFIDEEISVSTEKIDALIARLRRFVREEGEVMLRPATQDYLTRFEGKEGTNVI
jgi:hypothetical protein